MLEVWDQSESLSINLICSATFAPKKRQIEFKVEATYLTPRQPRLHPGGKSDRRLPAGYLWGYTDQKITMR